MTPAAMDPIEALRIVIETGAVQDPELNKVLQRRYLDLTERDAPAPRNLAERKTA